MAFRVYKSSSTSNELAIPNVMQLPKSFLKNEVKVDEMDEEENDDELDYHINLSSQLVNYENCRMNLHKQAIRFDTRLKYRESKEWKFHESQSLVRLFQLLTAQYRTFAFVIDYIGGVGWNSLREENDIERMVRRMIIRLNNQLKYSNEFNKNHHHHKKKMKKRNEENRYELLIQMNGMELLNTFSHSSKEIERKFQNGNEGRRIFLGKRVVDPISSFPTSLSSSSSSLSSSSLSPSKLLSSTTPNIKPNQSITTTVPIHNECSFRERLVQSGKKFKNFLKHPHVENSHISSQISLPTQTTQCGKFKNISTSKPSTPGVLGRKEYFRLFIDSQDICFSRQLEEPFDTFVCFVSIGYNEQTKSIGHLHLINGGEDAAIIAFLLHCISRRSEHVKRFSRIEKKLQVNGIISWKICGNSIYEKIEEKKLKEKKNNISDNNHFSQSKSINSTIATSSCGSSSSIISTTSTSSASSGSTSSNNFKPFHAQLSDIDEGVCMETTTTTATTTATASPHVSPPTKSSTTNQLLQKIDSLNQSDSSDSKYSSIIPSTTSPIINHQVFPMNKKKIAPTYLPPTLDDVNQLLVNQPNSSSSSSFEVSGRNSNKIQTDQQHLYQKKLNNYQFNNNKLNDNYQNVPYRRNDNKYHHHHHHQLHHQDGSKRMNGKFLYSSTSNSLALSTGNLYNKYSSTPNENFKNHHHHHHFHHYHHQNHQNQPHYLKQPHSFRHQSMIDLKDSESSQYYLKPQSYFLRRTAVPTAGGSESDLKTFDAIVDELRAKFKNNQKNKRFHSSVSNLNERTGDLPPNPNSSNSNYYENKQSTNVLTPTRTQSCYALSDGMTSKIPELMGNLNANTLNVASKPISYLQNPTKITLSDRLENSLVAKRQAILLHQKNRQSSPTTPQRHLVSVDENFMVVTHDNGINEKKKLLTKERPRYAFEPPPSTVQDVIDEKKMKKSNHNNINNNNSNYIKKEKVSVEKKSKLKKRKFNLGEKTFQIIRRYERHILSSSSNDERDDKLEEEEEEEEKVEDITNERQLTSQNISTINREFDFLDDYSDHDSDNPSVVARKNLRELSINIDRQPPNSSNNELTENRYQDDDQHRQVFSPILTKTTKDFINFMGPKPFSTSDPSHFKNRNFRLSPNANHGINNNMIVRNEDAQLTSNYSAAIDVIY
ncbi:hypothetical protein SNEBB_008328 [Seison nebaliae]|nr:hypothetical protein SNEBB_008328 [Seison nebaliae]